MTDLNAPLPGCAYCGGRDWALEIHFDDKHMPKVYQACCNVCGGKAPPAAQGPRAVANAARRDGDGGPAFVKEQSAQLPTPNYDLSSSLPLALLAARAASHANNKKMRRRQ